MVCRLKGHFQEASTQTAQPQFGVVINLSPPLPTNPQPGPTPTREILPPVLRFDFESAQEAVTLDVPDNARTF
jgi:hypothetical protein